MKSWFAPYWRKSAFDETTINQLTDHKILLKIAQDKKALLAVQQQAVFQLFKISDNKEQLEIFEPLLLDWIFKPFEKMELRIKALNCIPKENIYKKLKDQLYENYTFVDIHQVKAGLFLEAVFNKIDDIDFFNYLAINGNDQEIMQFLPERYIFLMDDPEVLAIIGLWKPSKVKDQLNKMGFGLCPNCNRQGSNHSILTATVRYDGTPDKDASGDTTTEVLVCTHCNYTAHRSISPNPD